LKGRGVLQGPVLVVGRLYKPVKEYIIGRFIREERGYG
jgi:hypothetical protein